MCLILKEQCRVSSLIVLNNGSETKENQPPKKLLQPGVISRNSEQSSQFIPVSTSHENVVVIAVFIRDLPLS